MFAALNAGRNPDTIPTIVEKPNPIKVISGLITPSKINPDWVAKYAIICDKPYPKIVPIAPPIKPISAASITKIISIV